MTLPDLIASHLVAFLVGVVLTWVVLWTRKPTPMSRAVNRVGAPPKAWQPPDGPERNRDG